jgi:BsuBI/PstI restriction endonuclease domain/BsuBI/PstI restriction endonuclease HTH domain
MTTKRRHLASARRVLIELGMPKAQQNERSAVSLLALLNLRPGMNWSQATDPLIGITPTMTWAREHYDRDDAPNTRETFRRQTMHQFVEAGIALYNPDDPTRPVNSPKAVYQVSPPTLQLMKTQGTQEWQSSLAEYLKIRRTLADQYAAARRLHQIPVTTAAGKALALTPGDHSQLIKAIIEDFAPRFAPGSALVYAGDTGSKAGYFDEGLLAKLGVVLDRHGKLPDVVLHYVERNWVLLIESVTSHGPVDGKRHGELSNLFATCSAGLVYVTAFPNRQIMGRYLPEIAWETEVWCADAPSHLIHFNGTRFLGPYGAAQQ